jgi:signal transduction histidine kinase
MSRRILKWLTVILPVFFITSIFAIRFFLSPGVISWSQEILTLLIILVSSFIFSNWVFRVINRRETEIQLRSEQLAALHEAALTLTRELDLQMVLQKVVDLARELSGARFGALGVLSEDGTLIEQFITSGMSSQSRKAVGDPPKGYGLLGALIREGKPIRISNISKDIRSAGFPPNHPKMASFLGVPINFKGEVIGNLYLADKFTRTGELVEFSKQDQQILEMFATQGAIAIKNAQLYRQSMQLSVFQERERFGMDLHDGIIQSIYAIGLMLEDTQHRIDESPASAFQGITHAIHGLNEVIRDLRNYILDLRPERFQGRNLRDGLGELARDLRANSFLSVHLDLDGADVTSLAPEQTVEILHIVQESLSNIRKHARATTVDVGLSGTGDYLTVTITDDGIGLTPERIQSSAGNGLHNMQERALELKGKIEFSNPEKGGTQVVLKVPTRQNKQIAEKIG